MIKLKCERGIKLTTSACIPKMPDDEIYSLHRTESLSSFIAVLQLRALSGCRILLRGETPVYWRQWLDYGKEQRFESIRGDIFVKLARMDLRDGE